MKVWCYFGADGRICADSDFSTEDDAWRIMLGWPTVEEVNLARAKGDRMEQIEIQLPSSENEQQ